jgi:Flp pilus assembly protein TadG
MRADSARGQALLETALITPFFLAVLLGSIEIGRYAHYSIAVANSARAGAEYATLNPTNAASTSGMITAANNDASTLSPSPTATATTFCQCADGTASTCLSTDCSTSHILKYAKVTVSGTYTGLFKYPGIQHSITVSKTASLQYPQW